MSVCRAGTMFLAFQALVVSAAFCQTAELAGVQEASKPAETSQQQPTTNPAPPSQAPPPASIWSIGGIDFSGEIDGYYNWNANHPSSGTSQLLLWNTKANQFNLNMAKITLNHDPDPVGFRLDFGFGHAFDVLHSTERSIDSTRYIEQAFISLKPKSLKGLQIDFGDFVTAAGAEVFDTKDNWNYSRSLLFGYAEPFYHFGLRTSMPVGKNFSFGVQLVNGWNNIEDNNSGKTLGLTASWTTSKIGWSNTYYVGPEKNDTNKGIRNYFDSVLTLTPTPKLSAYLNFDYGQERNLALGLDRWIGYAAALRYQVNNWFALAPRAEYFYDATGFNTGTPTEAERIHNDRRIQDGRRATREAGISPRPFKRAIF